MLEIEFYGVLQQVAGTQKRQLEKPMPGATVGEVLEQLGQELPALQPHLGRVACAQGETLIRRNQTVANDQPLVLLPPVSGG